MKKLNLLTAAAVASLALTACSGVQASSTDTAPAGTNQGASAAAPADVSEAAEATTAAQPDEAESTAASGVAAFGEAYTWQDGLAVTVGKPAVYKPSEWAAGTDTFKSFVIFEVRVVNKTKATWDPALLHITVQSDNQEAEQVFDSQKLADQPTTKLLPGREAKFPVAFGVANPKDLVMEVTPDFEHESVLFQQ
ncbi:MULTISPECIES: hypothetical protein [unclassified Luteococcus]|uniref:hypothetical protein n=1 Tax=unclassified Luteococcus TaxID=2639923 RepID=UPI00313C7748